MLLRKPLQHHPQKKMMLERFAEEHPGFDYGWDQVVSG